MEDIFYKNIFEGDVYSIASPPPLIVLNKSWSQVSEKELELLSKILNSIGLSLAAVQVKHLKVLDLNELRPIPKQIIGFGTSIRGIEKNELITTPHSRLILTESLESLIKDEEMKKKLWQALKQLSPS